MQTATGAQWMKGSNVFVWENLERIKSPTEGEDACSNRLWDEMEE